MALAPECENIDRVQRLTTQTFSSHSCSWIRDEDKGRNPSNVARTTNNGTFIYRAIENHSCASTRHQTFFDSWCKTTAQLEVNTSFWTSQQSGRFGRCLGRRDQWAFGLRQGTSLAIVIQTSKASPRTSVSNFIVWKLYLNLLRTREDNGSQLHTSVVRQTLR